MLFARRFARSIDRAWIETNSAVNADADYVDSPDQLIGRGLKRYRNAARR
jgi:hypothetical protein